MGKKDKAENMPADIEEIAAAEEEINVDESDLVDSDDATPEEEVGPDYQAEAEKNKDLYLRALADLENYRKRAQRDKEEAIRFANDNLLREMIPVIDNLERAVEHAGENRDQSLLEGVRMTLDQFRKVLESFGVKTVESLGEPFNPDLHQAMGEMVTGEYPPNCVAQEMQKAYTLNGRLLRPALVMVAKPPAPDEEKDENPDPAEPGPEN